jgi:hypothetical protein
MHTLILYAIPPNQTRSPHLLAFKGVEKASRILNSTPKPSSPNPYNSGD